ncbi:hypothetical protein C8R31_104282 [Nitrosospira sp. Nsp2]|uniref:hypothetical protein n=1 Tax=Nitrosospira sp. Nsp2 TaxID=136548 RepID=UPI000D323B3C|nr:hypothetical protein [Nitrosospira sp. Nsp2]PTR15253.1 hypothetical protein C8R31_104282 [Nitrosospira sp. Nsp2]
MEDDSIFNQEHHSNEATAFLAKKHNSVMEQVKGMRNAFHDLHKEATAEPDWSRMLMQAQSQQAKMQIRAARETYEEEAKYKAWEAIQKVQDGKVTQILSKPLHERNKQFYDELRRSDVQSYYDTKVQAQRRRDIQTLGLAYHLKNGGK